MVITEEEIEAARSPRGGWTRATLARWGVPWPAPKGWRRALVRGDPVPVTGKDTLSMSPIRAGIPAHDLLCKVVSAVIAYGHASDLSEFPDVLAYFGSQLPDDPDTAYGPATRHFFEGGER